VRPWCFGYSYGNKLNQIPDKTGQTIRRIFAKPQTSTAPVQAATARVRHAIDIEKPRGQQAR